MIPGRDDIVYVLREHARGLERLQENIYRAADEIARLRVFVQAGTQKEKDIQELVDALGKAVSRGCDHCYPDLKVARSVHNKFCV